MLNVNLNGNLSGFTQMLDRAKMQAQGFTNAVTHNVGESWGGIGKMLGGSIAGMFTVEGVKGFVESVMDTGKEIKQLSEQMDMGADDVQKWSKSVDRAGLSMNGLQTIVAKFQELKSTAKLGSAEGVKAREQLNNLGVSNDEILTEDGFSGGQIARIMGNADQGAEQRARLGEVVGTRGLKYGAAAKFYQGAEPDWDKGDRDTMEQAEQGMHKVKQIGTKIGVGLFKMFTDSDFRADYIRQFRNISPAAAIYSAFNPDKSDERSAPLPLDKSPDGRHKRITEQYKKRQEAAQQAKDDAEAKRKADAGMTGYKKTQDMEFEAQKQAAKFALDRAKGGMMTIGDRREMIRGDLGTLNKEVAGRDAASKAGKLYGLTDDEDKADKDKSESEHQKKLRAQELELMQKQTQSASMQAELKEKPMSFQADSMSKVGLYSASAVAFNPLLGIAQRQLTVLHTIAKKIGGHSGGHSGGKDPHFNP